MRQKKTERERDLPKMWIQFIKGAFLSGGRGRKRETKRDKDREREEREIER